MATTRQVDPFLVQFKNIARGSRTPLPAVGAARKKLPIETYAAAAQWLESTALGGKRVIGAAFPDAPQRLHERWRLAPLELEEEFRWAASRILLHGEKMASFAAAAREISDLVMRSEYRTAIERLDRAESDVGVSIWGLKLRLALLQRAEGFEAQKHFAISVRSVAVDSLTSYIVHYVSIRNETALSPASFTALFERNRSDLKISPDLAAYTEFHILPRIPQSRQSVSDILSWEGSSSVVDMYETTIRVSGYLATSSPAAFRSAAGPAIHELAKHINDQRLYALDAKYLNDWSTGSLPTIDLAPFESFLRGKYSEAIERSVEAIRKGSPAWEHLDLIGRAAAAGHISLPPDPSTFAWDVALWINHHLSHDKRAAESTEHLRRLALNLDGLLWADRANGFLVSEGDSGSSGVEHSASGAAMPPLSLHPAYASKLDLKGAQKYLDACKRTYGSVAAVRYAEALLGQSTIPDEMSSSIRHLARADQALRRGEPRDALAAGADITEASGHYFVSFRQGCVEKW